MQQQRNMKKQIWLLALLLCCSAAVLAQRTEDIRNYLDGRRSVGAQVYNQMRKDSVVHTVDDKWWDATEKAKIDLTGYYRIKNIVSLRLKEDSSAAFTKNFTVKVPVRLLITDSANTLDTSTVLHLQINYDTLAGASYDVQSYGVFYNAYKVSAKILGVDSGSTNLGFEVSAFLTLHNDMEITREYVFGCAPATMILDTAYDAANGELVVSWQGNTDLQSATAFDVEWAAVDAEALTEPDLYLTGGQLDADKIFRNNATRVTVAGTEYRIPILYDAGTVVFIRYRYVQDRVAGQRYEGNWSSGYNKGLKQFTVPGMGHEPNLNWQGTTSFAEEGKRKTVVQYYDGSLRARQTVTKDNSTNKTVVAETLYDYQGRPTIQVLPAPTLSSLIQYSRNFNMGLNAGTDIAYTKELYDSLYSPADFCLTPAPAMSNTTGAAHYYSASNAAAGTGMDQFIPKANGYAFTETRYMQDNTGRVQAQSGVGDTFRLGSGHETRYFYGNPSQQELDGLFGTEVGYATHYFKNMVRDANGQYSVSYVDMHGRTIATALAGKAPEALDTLPSYKQVMVTEPMADSTSNITSDWDMISTRSLLVPVQGNYTFYYSLNPDSLRLLNCKSNAICYDCLYHLEITITDECNNCHLPGQKPYVVVDSNFTFGQIDTLCNVPKAFVDTFTINLPEGNYTVTKKLSISRYGFTYLRDSVFMVKNTCKSFADFYKEQVDSMKASLPCTPEGCDTCSSRTASIDAFRLYYLNAAGIAFADSAQYGDAIWAAYIDAKEQCKWICGQVGEHTAIRMLMLDDMTVPSGQYANVDSANTMNAAYNILNDGTDLWRTVVYHDELGQPDLIQNSNGDLVVPTDASISKAWFIANFKKVWAKDLLPLHPEYDKLIQYETYSSSHIWDEKFGAVDSYAAANTSGYLNPAGNTTIPSTHINTVSGAQDPLTQSGALLNGTMKGAVYSYQNDNGTLLSMWGVASISSKCTGTNASCLAQFTNSTLNNCFNPAGFCTGELDMAWRAFRQLYLTDKRRRVMLALDSLYPSVHTNIPPYRHEHFAWSNAAMDNYGASIAGQGMGQILSGANAQVQEFYQSTCEGYATGWLHQLAPCSFTAADSARLIPRMVAICTAGSNQSHPWGSSSAPVGSGLTYTSFESLIKHYVDSMHTVNPSAYPAYGVPCNAYLVTYPEPYDNQTALADEVLWTKPDSCGCSRLSGLYSSYKQYGSGSANFAAYLLQQTGVSMNNDDLLKLLNMCSGLDTCKFLTAPIYLPPALQCGAKDVCVPCARVQQAYDSFLVKFNGIRPSWENNDSVQALHNQAFANYMNHQLGFVKETVEYLGFMNQCGIAWPADTAGCNQLQGLLTTWQQTQYNPTVPKLDVGGCDTSKLKVNVPGTGLYHTATAALANWMDNGIWKAPWNDTTNFTPAFIYRDTLCVDSVAIETRLRMPVNDKALARYIAANGSSSGFGSVLSSYVFNNKTVWMRLINGRYYKTINPALNDSIYAQCWVEENGGSNPTTPAYLNTGLKYLSDWTSVKVKVQGQQVQYYLYGFLFTTVNSATAPVSQFYQVIHRPQGHGFEADWLRFHHKTGAIAYQEDFIGCGSLARQTLPRCEPDCKQGFVTWFNAQQGTSYNYYSIDTLYRNHCGVIIDPCTATALGCAQLQQAVGDWYIGRHNVWYDTAGVEKNILPLASNYVYRNMDIYSMKDFVRDGIWSVPDSVTVNKGDFSIGHVPRICAGNDFAIEARVRAKPGVDPTLVQIGLNVWFGPGGDYVLRALFVGNSGYNGMYGTKPTGTGSSVGFESWAGAPPAAPLFGNWRRVRLVCKNDTASLYVDDTLFRKVHYPIRESKMSYTLAGWYESPIDVDYIRIYDGVGTLQYNEDFTGYTAFAKVPPVWICPEVDCSSSFASFYNGRFGTSLGYNAIAALYQANCATALPPCGQQGPLLCGKGALFPRVETVEAPPCADSSSLAFVRATELYKAYKDSLLNAFENRYTAKCLGAFKTEVFTVTHPQSEYHYTLYYYDQGGNLVKTVPPEGVDISKMGKKVWLDSVAQARKNGTLKVPAHWLATQYRYNTLNQVVTQYTPDADQSRFWYDRLGRLTTSQNAKQKYGAEPERYSYTRYDWLGRIKEVGELYNYSGTGLTQAVARDTAAYRNWFATASVNDSSIGQVTRTYYDFKYGSSAIPLTATNLRSRVAYTTYTEGNHPTNYNAASFYSYDIHGNVDTLLQDYGNETIAASQNVMNMNGANRWKRMEYRYDLISGKVNSVAYQPGKVDAFYHRYGYDAENRLVLAETSTDSTVWQKDARYGYYRHGPLARLLLGDKNVQGLDYAYTLQGWLKGVNSNVLSPGFDMGNDGDINNPATAKTARDAYGFGLNYYHGDGANISGRNIFAATYGYLPAGQHRNLYNGNIASMAVNIGKFNSTGSAGDSALVYNYKYDQLNRIVAMDAWRGLNTTNNTWGNGFAQLDVYKERVRYDANGNILKYLRHGNKTGTPVMDSLHYKYTYASGKLQNNRLNWVSDNVADAAYADDIDNQSAGNYTYDAIGNLMSDAKDSISNIQWNVYGKIMEIQRIPSAARPVSNIRYSYDAAGNRIGKRVAKYNSTAVDYTWYVRDASGKVMGTYGYTSTSSNDLNGANLMQNEVYLYGSSRLGALAVNRNVEDTLQPRDSSLSLALGLGSLIKRPFVRGIKQYELSNHLGNVLVTVSDRKLGVDDGTYDSSSVTGLLEKINGTKDGKVDWYVADVLTAGDYYPFGMGMSGRKFSAGGKYRYGFNGKEEDYEIEGQEDYGFRIYDKRLVRFKSTDPLTKKYPELTPYQFASNTPIQAIDLDGLEAFFVHGTNSSSKRWTETLTAKKAVQTLIKITNNKFYNTGFNWKAPLSNKEKTRAKAADQLADYVMAHRVEGEDITLIGHSHGGNVAIQAAKIIYQKTGKKVNIITVATPAYNKKGDNENPETQKAYINDHIAIWNKIDGISGGLAGDDYYTNSTITTNIEINVNKYYIKKVRQGKSDIEYEKPDAPGAHSFDVEHPDTIDDAIKSGKLRKLKTVAKSSTTSTNSIRPNNTQ